MEFAQEEIQRAPGLAQNKGGTCAAEDVSEESSCFPLFTVVSCLLAPPCHVASPGLAAIQCSLGLSWAATSLAHAAGAGSHQGVAVGWGDPVSWYNRKTHLPFQSFYWARSSLHLLCPKEVVLPSAACDCWFLSLCYLACVAHTALLWPQSTPEWSSGGVQCGAHPFITSWESTEILGSLKPFIQLRLTDRRRVQGTCWRTAVAAREHFHLLVSARLSSCNTKVSSPSYSALSFFANWENGIMLVASSDRALRPQLVHLFQKQL